MLKILLLETHLRKKERGLAREAEILRKAPQRKVVECDIAEFWAHAPLLQSQKRVRSKRAEAHEINTGELSKDIDGTGNHAN